MSTLELDMEKLKRSLICEICTELLGSPFMLTCGHVFCYGCILDWLLHKRTCPTCRRSLSQSPSFLYLVQEMVDVFVYRMEVLDPEGEGRLVRKHQEEQRQRMEKNKGNLFFDLFPETIHAGALCDREDGVMRCMRCFWEIEGSVCTHCGFQFSDENSGSFDDFSQDEVQEASESNVDRDSLYQDSIRSELDDYDYEDSFIDDRPTDEIECDISFGESNNSKNESECVRSKFYSDTTDDCEFDGTDHDSFIQEQKRRSKRLLKRRKDVSSNIQHSKNSAILLSSDENVNIHEDCSILSNSSSILIFPSTK